MNEGNVVYVGRKPVKNHVPAVLTCFNRKGFEDVVLRIKDRTVGVAGDTAEAPRRRLKRELTTSVGIVTEQSSNEEGGTGNVSCLEIILRKPTTVERKSITMDDTVTEEKDKVRTLLGK